MTMVLAVFGLVARVTLFPWRFSMVRRVSLAALLVAGLGAGVAGAIARLCDAGGGTFTLLFLALYGAGTALAIAAFIGLRRMRTRAARTLEGLLLLTPTQFEQAVARMLRGVGYRDVSVVGGPGDLAADILCRDRKGRSVAVQCKRKTPGQRVGSSEMQKFIGMISVHHEADAGIFVTTSEFTRPAIELAERHGIILIDGDALSKMMRRRDGRRPALPGSRAA